MGVLGKNQNTVAAVQGRLDELQGMIVNSYNGIRRSIGNALGVSKDGKRDLYDLYGYPRCVEGVNGFEVFYDYAHRTGLGSHLTLGKAKRCWRDGYKLYPDNDDDSKSINDDEIEILRKTGLFNKLEAADTLGLIGEFSVLYVGVPDGGKPEEPLGKAINGSESLKDLYYVAYPYDGIEISGQVDNLADSRYGMPEFYHLQRSPRGADKDTDLKSIRAHWSRCVHVAHDTLTSDICGTPGLKAIINDIIAVEKAAGGASEAYPHNVQRLLGYELDPAFSSDFINNPEAKKSFKEAASNFSNQLESQIIAAGSKIKSIQASHYSPADTVMAHLWNIAAYSGEPIRVLTGQGAGQLAGSEDQATVNQLTADRQRLVCAVMLEGVLNILVKAAMMSLPDTYQARSELQSPTTEKEQAEIADKKAGSIQKVSAAVQASGGAIQLRSALDEIGCKDVKTDDIDIDTPPPKEAAEGD